MIPIVIVMEFIGTEALIVFFLWSSLVDAAPADAWTNSHARATKMTAAYFIFIINLIKFIYNLWDWVLK